MGWVSPPPWWRKSLCSCSSTAILTSGLRLLDPPKDDFPGRTLSFWGSCKGTPASCGGKSIIRGIVIKWPRGEKTTQAFLPHALMTSIEKHLPARNEMMDSNFQKCSSLPEINWFLRELSQELFPFQISNIVDNFQMCCNGQRKIAILPSGAVSVAKLLRNWREKTTPGTCNFFTL